MLKTVILSLIEGYQRFLSPFKTPSCRFFPTCSEYAKESIENKGLVKGIFFSFVRLAKCHPLHAGGHDPVLR